MDKAEAGIRVKVPIDSIPKKYWSRINCIVWRK